MTDESMSYSDFCGARNNNESIRPIKKSTRRRAARERVVVLLFVGNVMKEAKPHIIMTSSSSVSIVHCRAPILKCT